VVPRRYISAPRSIAPSSGFNFFEIFSKDRTCENLSKKRLKKVNKTSRYDGGATANTMSEALPDLHDSHEGTKQSSSADDGVNQRSSASTIPFTPSAATAIAG
jgi:hypothetical protein